MHALRVEPELVMEPKMTESCETCRFGKRLVLGWVKCQRNPPLAQPGSSDGFWPNVSTGAWCGEYARAPSTEAKA